MLRIICNLHRSRPLLSSPRNCAEVRVLPNPAEDSAGISIPVSMPTSAGSHGKTIVGYYASWQWYDRQKKAAPENMDFTKVQRVNFAFFQTDETGNMWGTDNWADPNLLFGPYNWNPSAGSKEYCSWDYPTSKVCNYHHYEKGLIHLVHAAGAEIYPSIGGWTLVSSWFCMHLAQEHAVCLTRLAALLPWLCFRVMHSRQWLQSE